MKKIATIIGARPQFIKATMVSRALKNIKNIDEILIHTGQHYDRNMSEIFFGELGIEKPKYNLGVASGNHGAQTGKMLESIENVLLKNKVDYVLIYGDTNSTLAGALAASKLNIPLAHVEAGVRSYNRSMPEEINRIVADHVADIHFAPTKAAVQNLEKEGVFGPSVHLVGDVMYDATLHYSEKSLKRSNILETLKIEKGNYLLATIHRAENTEDPDRLKTIFEVLSNVSLHMQVVFPMHPRTRNGLKRYGIRIEQTSAKKIIQPVGYLDMIQLEANARVIVTDSGGVQKEAYFHKVPCVTFREETEWVELLEIGANRLSPPGLQSAMYKNILEMAEKEIAESNESLYGDGDAANKIVSAMTQILSK